MPRNCQRSPRRRPFDSLSHAAIDGHKISDREAVPKDAATILLLHGFPTSSHMFRNLIPESAEKYRVVAPDLPGFGFTESPSRKQFSYIFENLAKAVGAFIEASGLSKFAIYIFDYAAPRGLRLALAHPEKVTAIITQKGNAYVDGLSECMESDPEILAGADGQKTGRRCGIS
jgi:pimeloyl-ACP methyl ester carboxylesterase